MTRNSSFCPPSRPKPVAVSGDNVEATIVSQLETPTVDPRIAKYKKAVHGVRESGLSITKACAEAKISKNTYKM